jgi:hypothetical protein
MSIEKEVFPFMASDAQLFAMELAGFWMVLTYLLPTARRHSHSLVV